MALNARKLEYPTASALFAPHLDMKKLADSAQVWVPVANVTERAAVVAAVGTVDAEHPVCVIREDAGAGLELEYTTDGMSWWTVPGYADSDTWHTLGAGGFGSLTSGTTSYTTSPWSGVRVRRHRGVLYVSGAAVRASWSDGTGIGTLPEGYRPSVHAQGYRCQLSTSGSLAWNGGSASGAQSFSLVVPL